MRVFVVGTGRCGTDTFARACRHITNFTVAHESKVGMKGPERLDFPDRHIEADNRLSWFLGSLDLRYGADAFYVHLLRDPEKVAESYNHRWGWRFSIVDAFGYGILHRRERWPEQEKLDVCRLYVQTVTDNIRVFLRDRPNHIEMRLETIKETFPEFWKRIGAQGDLDAAIRTWDTSFNQMPAGHRNSRLRSLVRWILKHASLLALGSVR